LLQSSLHFADSLQNSSISHKIHVAQWRSTTCRPMLRLTDPTNGRLAPSRCQPPCLDPYSASLLAWTPTLLMYIWTWSLPSSMLWLQYLSSLSSAGSSVSLLLAPQDASSAAWFSSAAAPTCRPHLRQPRPCPWPYLLTLLHHSYRLLCCCRHTGHLSLAIPLGPPSPPRASVGRLICSLCSSPPSLGPSPPSSPTHDFQFPSHLPQP
jgi:hypothetical protein